MKRIRSLILVAALAAAVLGSEAAVKPPDADAACFTIRCFNKQIAKLKRKVARLNYAVFQCERLVPVTQYYGYKYDFSGTEGLTTALDVTDSGDPADAFVVVDVCATASSAAARSGIPQLRDLDFEPQRR